MRQSLFYGTSKICFPRTFKRDRFGRPYLSMSSFGMTPGYVRQMKTRQESLEQSGRSILEVLAVIGLMSVISFGGIKGYEYAKNKVKARNMANMVSTLVKERQAKSLSLAGNKSDIQKVKVGDKEVTIQNGTSQDGDKEPFFWIDIDLDKKEECEEFLYTDSVTPSFVAIDNSIPGECPGKVRLYFPKDPKDILSGIRTYVNPVDGKTYVCQGDECSEAGGSGNNSYGLACRKGYTANAAKTACEKITCSGYPGSDFAGDSYTGGFVGFANDGASRCYCPTGQTFGENSCITPTSECSGHGSNSAGSCSCLAGYCGRNCENRIACFNAGRWTENGCECAEGWTGTYCNEAASNGCSNHGVFANGSCTCNDGYYGADCSGYNNCSGNGTVDSSGNCTCNDGYYGADCSGYNNCSGNGTVDSSGNCTCNDGYYGTYCEGYNDCSGNGRVNSDGSCTCNDGYYGTYCENETGEYNAVCNGHGTLDWPGRNYFRNSVTKSGDFPDLCLCDKGYFEYENNSTHSQCGIAEENCSGRGQWTTCGCLCEPGYCGFSCQVASENICNKRGRFINFGSYDYCLCNDDTFVKIDGSGKIYGSNNQPCVGSSCSTGYFQTCGGECIPCDADGSYNAISFECAKCGSQRQMCGGSCILADSGEYNACSGHGRWCGSSCSCDDGYYGTYCENETGEYNACSGHGTLNWAGANHWSQYPSLCLCDEPYGNTDCQTNYFEKEYSPHGQRMGLSAGSDAYVCDAGYYGPHCDEYKGLSSVCNGNGQYLAYGASSLGCLCNDGTIQEGYNACASTSTDPCNGHGTLNWPGANYWPQYPDMCLCDKGYWRSESSMAQCSKFTYDSDNHKKAVGLINGGAYVCDEGYYGIHCVEYRGSSAVCNGNGQYIANGTSSLGCLCNDGTIQEGYNACATSGEYNACSGHGTLDWPGANYFSGHHVCLCHKGYFSMSSMTSSADSQCMTPCSDWYCCSNHGRFVGCGCLCDSGYYGSYCQEYRGSSAVCNGNGQFLYFASGNPGDASDFCLCNDGTIQEGYNACATSGEYNACSGHGTLDWPGGHYWPQFENEGGVCLCDKGYSDAICAIPWDNCNGHGQAISCGCLCDRNYYGDNCKIEGNSCNGFGRFGYNRGVTFCLCGDGVIHEGDYNCLSTSTECSGHGTWDYNKGYCVCETGYYGAYCEHADPCSGRGTLNWPGANYWSDYPNLCLCDEGYFSTSIFMSQCHNFVNVTRGTSLGYPDAYLCYAGYCGENCRTANSSVCSGNGRHIVIKGRSKGCLCNDGTIQTGDNACSGSGAYNACSGHGTWNGSSCVCYADWSGENCDVRSDCDGVWGNNGTCYSCSDTTSFASTITECARCDGTANPRLMVGSGFCYPCSYTSILYYTIADECNKCPNREMVGDNCVLNTASCNALYPTEGGVRSNSGYCRSCSDSGYISTTKDECDQCSNREMVGNQCVLTTAGCNALNPTTGGFRSNDGWCYSCSFSNYPQTTAAECAMCDGTNNPRFMDNNSYCYLCSYVDDVSTSQTECDKCATSSTPRFRSNNGNCYSCSIYSYISTTKAECDKCGNLRYMDGNYCRKK